MELRQNPQDWSYTETQMVNLINHTKEQCRIRNTELHVVLVQERNAARGTNNTPTNHTNNQPNFFDTNSDRVLLEIAGERVTALRRKIGFEGNGVTLLYTGDIAAPGSPLVAALDTILRERSAVYYQNQTRRIKKIINRITLPIQTHFRVRLLFKLAHFQEFRGRSHKALKYYSQAYAALASIMPSLSTPNPFIKPDLFMNILPQLKAIGDFINFKIMHSYLSSGNGQIITPSGVTGLTGAQAATMQFSNHIRTFEAMIGTASVTNPFPTCTHYAWLSKQYVTAAELLQLNLPRPTLDTRPQHIPCYYYHTAGLYAIRRRKAAETLGLLQSYTLNYPWNDTNIVNNQTNTFNPLTDASKVAQQEAIHWNIEPSIYIGGIPKISKKSDTDPTNSNRDENAALVAIICAEESSHNHSENIISLLERAQAMAVVDSGTGSNMVVPSSATSNTGETITTSFNRGSMFSYYPGVDASRSRFWRQWLIADELFVSQGKFEQTARLLAPIAATCRKDQWWSILVRIASRVRECAIGLQDKGLFISSSMDLLAASLSCAVPKVEDIFTSLIYTLQSTSKDNINHSYDIHLPPAKPLSLNPQFNEYGGLNEASLSLEPFPLPVHMNNSMKYAGAPLLCSTVLFSRRLVQRGDTISVRVITTSNLPKAITLDSLRVRFRGIIGDALLRAEIGIGSNILHNNTDDTRAFDIVIVHSNSKEANQAIATAKPADRDGISHIDLSTVSLSKDTSNPMVVKGSLIVPAHGSLCFQYLIRSPVSSKIPLNTSTSDLVQSLYSTINTNQDTLHIATTDSVLTAHRSTTTNNQTSSTLDRHSTNPFALAAVAGNTTTSSSSSTNPSTPVATPVPVEMEPGLDTIICEKVILAWSGNTEENTASSTPKGDTVLIHLTPRTLAPSNGDMRNIWLQPIIHQSTFPNSRITNRISNTIMKSTLLSIYEGEYLETLTSVQIKDILFALGTVLESCVAHMARTGATRTKDQAFAPRTNKSLNWGYIEGKIPDNISDAPNNDIPTVLSDNDLKGLQQLLHTITNEGKYQRLNNNDSKIDMASGQHTGTIVYGEDENVYAPMNSTALAGRLLHYHNVLILRPPVALCQINISRPSLSDNQNETTQLPCAMGGINNLQIHVGNNGTKAINGGILFLSPVQLLHRSALTSNSSVVTSSDTLDIPNTPSASNNTDDKGLNSSFADVDITVATDGSNGNGSTESDSNHINNKQANIAKTNADNQRMKRAEEILINSMKLLVPKTMLIITKGGEVIEAGKLVTTTSENGTSETTLAPSTGKKDKKKKKGDTDVDNTSTTNDTLATSSSSSTTVVPLHINSGILGIALPTIPNNLDYTFNIQLQTPSLLQIIQELDNIKDNIIISNHDYHLLHRLRCGIAGTLYALPADNNMMMNFSKPDEWLTTAAKNPHALVVNRAIIPIDIANPLHIDCHIQPNVNVPLLDTSPIIRYSTPFTNLPTNLLSRTKGTADETTLTNSSSTTAFIQKGTDFVSRLSIIANTCENIYITKVSLLSYPNATTNNNKIIELVEDNLQQQLVNVSLPNTTETTNNNSIHTLLNQFKPNISNGTLIRSGQLLHSSLRFNAVEVGTESMGCFQATVKVGTINQSEHIIQIPLSMVSIGSSPIRCDVVWPEVAVARNPVQVNVRITNTTPHFQALEVALQPPAVAWAKGNSTSVTTAHVEALQGLQVFEPLDRFTRYIVELLPNASKGVSFNLVAANSGYTVLPSVVVKGTRTEGRPEAKVGPMANVFSNVNNPNPIPGSTGSNPSTSAAANPATKTTNVSDVLTVVPIGPDGIPAPRGIYVSENQ